MTNNNTTNNHTTNDNNKTCSNAIADNNSNLGTVISKKMMFAFVLREEFTRLAETRLAQNRLNYIGINHPRTTIGSAAAINFYRFKRVSFKL